MIAFFETHWGSIYVAAEWIIRLAMVVVVPFRRSPEATRSWLLLVFFLPIPGLILYTLIGRPTYPKWRQQRFAGMPRLAGADDAIARGTEKHPPGFGERGALARLVGGLGHLPGAGGNAITLIDDYDGVIDRLCADIDAARDHVHILVYIFADDATGMRVIDALGRAAARGVTCRVLIDALGSRPWADRVLVLLNERGVTATKALAFRPFRPARADLRNHRKLIVIDGATGYIGSQNIVAREFKPGIVNEELVARVTGPVVAQIQSIFLTDWYLETLEQPDAPSLFPLLTATGTATAQMLPSGPDYPVAGSERLTVAMIYAAHRRVVLTTPYFIPDEGLLEAMQSAVLRGVEVRLVVSMVQDQWLVAHAQRSFYSELLRSGVRVFQYRGKLLHAKHVVADDDLVAIGSSNVDIRSFQLNAEAMLLIYGAGRIDDAHLLDDYASHSSELDAAEWIRRPLFHKILENLARLVSPLL